MVPVPGEGPLPPPVSRERPGVGKEGEGGGREIQLHLDKWKTTLLSNKICYVK